jgi:hypothetical protein
MIDRNLAQGVFLTVLALAFGAGALNYRLGTLSDAGPGLFPLMISGLLLIVGVISIIRSRFVEKKAMVFNLRNILLLLAALAAFAIVSELVSMSLGIIALVFVAACAGSDYSWKRNAKVAAVLLVVAFLFQQGFGLNIKLY